MLSGLVEEALAEAVGLKADLSWLAAAANPFCLTWASVETRVWGGPGGGVDSFMAYSLGGQAMSKWALTKTVADVALAYLVAGAAMAMLAKSRFRRGLA